GIAENDAAVRVGVEVQTFAPEPAAPHRSVAYLADGHELYELGHFASNSTRSSSRTTANHSERLRRNASTGCTPSPASLDACSHHCQSCARSCRLTSTWIGSP